MKAARGGIWIVGLLLLGPIAAILLIHLAHILISPACAQQWVEWCGEPKMIWTGWPRWSVTSKGTELIHALLLIAIFVWSSFQLLRAALTGRPLTAGMRYGVIAAILVWVVLFEL